MPGVNYCQYPQCGHSKNNCIINSSNSRVWFDLMEEYFPGKKFSVKRLFLCMCYFAKDDLLIILKLKPDAIPLKRKQPVDSENVCENSFAAQEEKKALECFSSDQILKLQNRKVKEWTPQMIETGLTVASSMSSNAYKNLTKLPSIALPSFSTLFQNLNYRCPPGILQIFINAMKVKKFNNNTRHVSLVFDETSICQLMRIDRSNTFICGNISKQFLDDNPEIKPDVR